MNANALSLYCARYEIGFVYLGAITIFSLPYSCVASLMIADNDCSFHESSVQLLSNRIVGLSP